MEFYLDGNDGVVEWTGSNSCVSVDNGVIKAISYGTAVIKATVVNVTFYYVLRKYLYYSI